MDGNKCLLFAESAYVPCFVVQAIEKHYSHIQPLRVSGRDAATVFAATKTAASSLPRASIVHEDAAAGVLELLDVTALARFKDDVAVRWVHRNE